MDMIPKNSVRDGKGKGRETYHHLGREGKEGFFFLSSGTLTYTLNEEAFLFLFNSYFQSTS